MLIEHFLFFPLQWHTNLVDPFPEVPAESDSRSSAISAIGSDTVRVRHVAVAVNRFQSLNRYTDRANSTRFEVSLARYKILLKA